MCDVILIGNRRDDKNIWILLFVPNMGDNYKRAICHFVKESLQRYIDRLEV
jgi:hypothetical protein